MSSYDIDFENFLSQEANRHFKTLPNGSTPDAERQALAEQSHHPNDLTVTTTATPVGNGPQAANEKLPTETSVAYPERIPFHFDINNPPTSFGGTEGSTGALLPSADRGLFGQRVAKENARVAQELFPFQDPHSDPVPELATLLKATNSFIHSTPLSGVATHPAYYFIDEGGFSTEGKPGFAQENVLATRGAALDIGLIRNDFPILSERVNGQQLVWLDNAATTQKPQQVIDRIAHFYQHENSNIHRAAHELAARATDAYEGARAIVQRFIHASSVNEIVFTRGTTESINLVANTWGEQHLGAGDEIILSHLEHHANIVPWQLLSKRKGVKIRIIPVDDEGNLLLDEYAKLLGPRTKLVSFTHVSNALGTVTPVKQIIDLAHQAGAKVLLDGAQSVSHIAVDVQKLNPDFFVFSGHKIFGPTGIGVLYGKEELLNSLPPYQAGGNMIKDVTFEHTTFHEAPNRFEAGTGNIADAVGLGAALEYVQAIGLQNIYDYEHELLVYASTLLREVPGVKLIGTAREKTSVLSFTLAGVQNSEVGDELNKVGIAVRTGHHCAQPILRRLGYESSVRPSIAFYNTREEIDRFIETVQRLAWRTRRY